MATFREWLNLVESSTPKATAARQSLYPLAYSTAWFMPQSSMVNWGPDALTYMPKKSFKYIWGDGFLSNPNPGEVNKDAWPEGMPDLTGPFKMIDDRGILSKFK